MGEIPAGVTVVSESGIAGSEQLGKLEEAGVDAVLVGESLMRSSDPEAALRALREIAPVALGKHLGVGWSTWRWVGSAEQDLGRGEMCRGSA